MCSQIQPSSTMPDVAAPRHISVSVTVILALWLTFPSSIKKHSVIKKYKNQGLKLAGSVWRILWRNLDFITFKVPSSLSIYMETVKNRNGPHRKWSTPSPWMLGQWLELLLGCSFAWNLLSPPCWGLLRHTSWLSLNHTHRGSTHKQGFGNSPFHPQAEDVAGTLKHFWNTPCFKKKNVADFRIHRFMVRMHTWGHLLYFSYSDITLSSLSCSLILLRSADFFKLNIFS